MTDSLLYWLTVEYKRQQPRIAQDTVLPPGYTPSELASSNPPASVYASITKRFDAESKRWQKSNREAAQRFGGRFADKNRAETLNAMNRNFEAAGLRTRVKGSRAANAIAGLQKTQTIDRVENIFQTYLKRVMAIALRDFLDGVTPTEFRKQIRRELAKTEVKAGNEARSMANELTQKTVKVQNADLGLHTYIWIHVPGKKFSRRTHEEFNGQEFDDSEGLYDREVHRKVLPGELKYCMCTQRVKIPDWLK